MQLLDCSDILPYISLIVLCICKKIGITSSERILSIIYVSWATGWLMSNKLDDLRVQMQEK